MAYETRKVQQYKIDAVNALKEKFKNSKDYIFADYRGLSVGQITELRKQLHDNNAEFRVVKNRFAKIAFKDLDYSDIDDYLIGPTAIALSQNEAPSIAKILVNFAKEGPLELKGGIVEGKVFTAEEVEQLSKLPSREELLAKLMGTMNAPVQNLAQVLNAIPAQLVRAVKAVADQKAEQES